MMLYVMIINNLFFLLLFIQSSKIKYQGHNQSKIEQVFYRMSLYIVSKDVVNRKLFHKNVMRQLELLYPIYEKKNLIWHYYAQKISVFLMFIFIGINMIYAKTWIDQRSSILQNGYIITRPDYGHDDAQVAFSVISQEKQTDLTYDVLSKKWSQKEIEKQMKDFEDHLQLYLLGDNSSFDTIQSNLRLSSHYGDFAFLVDWESDRYDLVDSDGTVRNESLNSPQTVTLQATMTYEEIEKIIQFGVVVKPKPKDKQEQEKELFLNEIQKEDEKQKEDTYFVLPKKIKGKDVSYQIKEDTDSGLYVIGLFGIAIVLLWAKDRDLSEKVKKREQQLVLIYSEFISQFTLYVNAGLSIRNTFIKLSEEGSLGEYLSQELKLLVRDLGNGVLEQDAIDAFGKRCKVSTYMKFSALLIQNRKKGNDELLQELKQEASEAFLKRKNDARKLGEEASTKLLLPMMGMLLVVMIVIVLPAFLSFQL